MAKKASEKAIKLIKTIAKNAPLASNQQKCPEWQIYVLELEEGHVYVGKSRDVERRVRQHSSGKGASFTKAYKPTGRRLPRLGTLSGDGDGPERDETLRWMYKLGPQRVRGWKYCTKTLTPTDLLEIEANIREMFDFCRRCGKPGHFSPGCRETVDRTGKPLRGRFRVRGGA